MRIFSFIGIGLLLVTSGCAVANSAKRYSAPRPSAVPTLSPEQKHAAEVVAWLKQKNPSAKIGLYPGLGNHLDFNADMTRSKVRSVNFVATDDATTIESSVWITGNQGVSTAPTVAVTLFDKDGVVLSRELVVKYFSENLEPGKTDKVSDKLTIPPGTLPYFVAIDEDKDVGLPAK